MRKGLFFALTGTVFISSYFIAGKYALEGFNAETFCFIWMSATVVFTFGIIAAKRKLREIRLAKSAVPSIVGLGISVGIGLVLLYSGLKLIDPTFTAFLARSLPVMVVLLGVVFLGERLKAIEILPMALMVGGGVISVWGRWETVGIGVTLALLGYVAFAFQRLFAKIGAGKVDSAVQVFYRAAIAWVVVTTWMLISGRADFNVPTKYWWVLFLGAFLSPCMGNMLSFHSYKYWSLSRNAMVLMIQPLLVLPMAWLFLARTPEPKAIIGGIVILVGALWVTWIHMPRKNRRPSEETELLAEETGEPIGS